jgi:hypothetical protein
MVTSATQPNLDGLLRSYAMLWQLWPQYAVLHGERRQIGFELELIGSHTLDPNHLDPGCSQCHRVRSILLAIADNLAHEVFRNDDSVTYDIDPHSASITCLPGLANRPCVTVSVIVTDNRAFEHATGGLGDVVVSNAREYLAELGIPQR